MVDLRSRSLCWPSNDLNLRLLNPGLLEVPPSELTNQTNGDRNKSLASNEFTISVQFAMGRAMESVTNHVFVRTESWFS